MHSVKKRQCKKCKVYLTNYSLEEFTEHTDACRGKVPSIPNANGGHEATPATFTISFDDFFKDEKVNEGEPSTLTFHRGTDENGEEVANSPGVRVLLQGKAMGWDQDDKGCVKNGGKRDKGKIEELFGDDSGVEYTSSLEENGVNKIKIRRVGKQKEKKGKKSVLDDAADIWLASFK